MTTAEMFAVLGEGFGLTVLLFAITLVLALPLGLVIAIGSESRFKPLAYFLKGFGWFVGCIPLLLQILIISFITACTNKSGVAGNKAGALNTEFLLCAVVFVVNYSFFFSNVFSKGIAGVPRGQYEACSVLGMTKYQAFIKVIMPQVAKTTVLPIGKETIALVKDTTLARALGVIEVVFAAQKAGSVMSSVLPLVYSALFFLLFNGVLTVLMRFLNKKANNGFGA